MEDPSISLTMKNLIEFFEMNQVHPDDVQLRKQEIETFCDRLKEHWTSGENYHVRLGQMIINQMNVPAENLDSQLYNVKDSVLLNKLIGGKDENSQV